MKRKYAAMVLGLVLTVSSMNVYAASAATVGTDTASDVTADGDETAEDTVETLESDESEKAVAEEVVGQVTAVEEDSITINVGTPLDNMDVESPEDSALAGETEEEQNAADAQSGKDEETEADSLENPEYKPLIINLTGEEETISVTDNTVVLREILSDETETDNTNPTDSTDAETTEPTDSADAESAATTDSTNTDTTDSTDSADTETMDDTESADTEATDEADTTDTETTDETDSTQADTTDTDTTDLADSERNEVVINGELVDGSLIQADIPTEEIELTDIKVGDMVVVTLDENGAAVITVKPQLDAEIEKPAEESDSDDINTETGGNTTAEADNNAETDDADQGNAEQANPDQADAGEAADTAN